MRVTPSIACAEKPFETADRLQWDIRFNDHRYGIEVRGSSLFDPVTTMTGMCRTTMRRHKGRVGSLCRLMSTKAVLKVSAEANAICSCERADRADGDHADTRSRSDRASLSR
jgi:hypothetical protein